MALSVSDEDPLLELQATKKHVAKKRAHVGNNPFLEILWTKDISLHFKPIRYAVEDKFIINNYQNIKKDIPPPQ